MDLKNYIRSIPDYPKKGILFRDITTLIKDNQAFKYTVDKIADMITDINFDKVLIFLTEGLFFKNNFLSSLNRELIIFFDFNFIVCGGLFFLAIKILYL